MKESCIPLPPINYPDGVTTIDVASVRSGFAASHLIFENGKIFPVPKERVLIAEDESRIDFH